MFQMVVHWNQNWNLRMWPKKVSSKPLSRDLFYNMHSNYNYCIWCGALGENSHFDSILKSYIYLILQDLFDPDILQIYHILLYLLSSIYGLWISLQACKRWIYLEKFGTCPPYSQYGCKWAHITLHGVNPA
jgi:hypothetical protein